MWPPKVRSIEGIIRLASVFQTLFSSFYDAENLVQQNLSDKELEEIEIAYRYGHTVNHTWGNMIVKLGIKFKKGDPKLKLLAAAKNVKSTWCFGWRCLLVV